MKMGQARHRGPQGVHRGSSPQGPWDSQEEKTPWKSVWHRTPEKIRPMGQPNRTLDVQRGVAQPSRAPSFCTHGTHVHTDARTNRKRPPEIVLIGPAFSLWKCTSVGTGGQEGLSPGQPGTSSSHLHSSAPLRVEWSSPPSGFLQPDPHPAPVLPPATLNLA